MSETLDQLPSGEFVAVGYRESIARSCDRVKELLLAAEDDELISMSNIKSLCYENVNPVYIRDKVRKIIQREEGILFEIEKPGVSMRRLPIANAVPTVSNSSRKRMSAQLKAHRGRVESINYADLPTREARMAYMTEAIRLALREELERSEAAKAAAIARKAEQVAKGRTAKDSSEELRAFLLSMG